MKIGDCWVCTKQRRIESHHIAPLEYGGAKDGAQVPLCPNCHSALDVGYKELIRTGMVQNHLGLSQECFKRYEYLCKHIVSTMSEFQKQDKPAADARRRLSIPLTAEEQRMVHYLRDVFGQTSIEKTIRALIRTVYDRECGTRNGK